MRYYLRSEIAKMADINPETLRFYEKNHLIPMPERASNGYRQYSEDVLIRLRLIKNAQNGGFTLSQIKELFTMAESVDDFVHAVNEKINEIDEKIRKMKAAKKTLEVFIKEMQTDVCPHIETFLNKEK